MKVAVLCEFSGTVRDAFIRHGHDAISCDILPTEAPGPHIQADLRTVDWSGYDLVVAHPPCTHLAVSGARWWPAKLKEQVEALEFVQWILDLPVPRIAVENPIGKINTAIRKPDQIIQPWMFGHGETKATCLWLVNVPPLMVTVVDQGRHPAIHLLPPSEDRWKKRSLTYPGIAEAMAHQWGCLPTMERMVA